jgi:uncharacterized protein YjbI with pentapeptide repeats
MSSKLYTTDSLVQRYCPFKGEIAALHSQFGISTYARRNITALHREHLTYITSRQRRGTQFNQELHSSLLDYFAHLSFHCADFTRARIIYFNDTACSGARFDHCDFKGGKFMNFYAKGTSFRHADFSSASFSSAHFSGTKFERCSFRRATFLDLKGKSELTFTNCDLREVKWDQTLACGAMSSPTFNYCIFSPDALPWLMLRQDWPFLKQTCLVK